MKKFCITRIEIYDIVRKEGYYTDFKEGVNVVTSSENHVGKSSLLKSIYYAFGANVNYDSAWDKKSKLICVNFKLEEKNYRICRFNNKYLILNDEKEVLLKTTNVGKELSPYLSKLFDLEIHLMNRENEVELSPPVYFFLPYYIDQDKGWESPFNSFLNLTQYTKEERLKSLYYHLNLYNKDTLSLTNKIDTLKKERLQYVQSNTKYNDIKEIMDGEIEVLDLVSRNELEKEMESLKNDIFEKIVKFENIKSHIEKLKTTLSVLEYNLEVLEKEFALEEGSTEIKCPSCGYEKCTIYNYNNKNIIADVYSELNTEFSISELKKIIAVTQEEIDDSTKQYLELYNEISEKKKKIQSNDLFVNYINHISVGNMKTKFDEKITNNLKKIDTLELEIQKDERELRKQQNPRNLNRRYKQEVINFLMDLNAWDNRSSDKITLLNPFKGQGSISVKSIIASYLALYKVMERYAPDIIKFSFIIDSPRSKEASDSSSEEILSRISNVSNLNQVIIATVDYDKYSSGVTQKVNKILLNNEKHLLSKEKYSELDNEELIEIMKSIE